MTGWEALKQAKSIGLHAARLSEMIPPKQRLTPDEAYRHWLPTMMVVEGITQANLYDAFMDGYTEPVKD